MTPIGLKVGDKVILTLFGEKTLLTISHTIWDANRPGYLVFAFKESTHVVRVSHLKTLDFWNDTPILL